MISQYDSVVTDAFRENHLEYFPILAESKQKAP